MKNKWLGRELAAPGPFLTLVLSQAEMDAVLKRLNIKDNIPFISNAQSNASVNFLTRAEGDMVAVVGLGNTTGRDPVEVAGILVHEAVHVWQEYAKNIGETNPGDEQEAYAIQGIAQQLMAEYARRLNDRST